MAEVWGKRPTIKTPRLESGRTSLTNTSTRSNPLVKEKSHYSTSGYFYKALRNLNETLLIEAHVPRNFYCHASGCLSKDLQKFAGRSV
jgi:hypothetical protein